MNVISEAILFIYAQNLCYIFATTSTSLLSQRQSRFGFIAYQIISTAN